MKHGDRLQSVGSTTARRNHHSRCFPVLSCPVPAVTGYCTGPTTTSTVTPTGDCAAAPLLLICSPSVPIRSRGVLTHFPTTNFFSFFFQSLPPKYNRRLLILLLVLVFAITPFGRLRRQSQSFLVSFFSSLLLRARMKMKWPWISRSFRSFILVFFFFLVIFFVFFSWFFFLFSTLFCGCFDECCHDVKQQQFVDLELLYVCVSINWSFNSYESALFCAGAPLPRKSAKIFLLVSMDNCKKEGLRNLSGYNKERMQ